PGGARPRACGHRADRRRLARDRLRGHGLCPARSRVLAAGTQRAASEGESAPRRRAGDPPSRGARAPTVRSGDSGSILAGRGGGIRGGAMTEFDQIGLRNRRAIPMAAVPTVSFDWFGATVVDATRSGWRLVALFGLCDRGPGCRLYAILAND